MNLATLESWVSQPEAWAVLGIALAVVELLIGAMIALPLGLAAIVVSGLMFAGIVTSWQFGLAIFGVLGILSSLAIRKFIDKISKAKAPDINQY